MSTVSSEPSTSLLDEQIDYAEQLISEGDLRHGASLLEELRRKAFSERDREAVQRIADIAGSARYLSRRFQSRFDRLHFIAEGNAEVLERGRPTPLTKIPERQAVGGGALAGAIALHFLIGWAAYAVTEATKQPVAGFSVITLWDLAGGLLWAGTLGVIIWRWSEFRERMGLLARISLGFLIAAPFAFIPLIALVEPRVRRYVGLVRGPR